MRDRFVRYCLVALAVTGLLTQSLGASAWARPQGRSSDVWSEPQPIKPPRPPKNAPRRNVSRRQPIRKSPAAAPLLTLQWRVLMRGQMNVAAEANPTAIFHAGDQVRLEVTANQPGYLYVIQMTQASDGRPLAPAQLVFPDSRIDGGRNYVDKNVAYTVPGICPGFADSHDCWLMFGKAAGDETFVVIFSRDMITDLTAQVLGNGAEGARAAIDRLRINSGQQLVRSSAPGSAGAGRFVTWSTNRNASANQEIIETIVLQHQ